MSYLGKFNPKVQTFQIEDDGDVETFHVRKPRALEMIKRGDEMKDKTPSNEASSRDLISKYVVHEDGSAISAEEVEALLVMRISAFSKLSEKLVEIISGGKRDEKKD
jgi:hypothetical protein